MIRDQVESADEVGTPARLPRSTGRWKQMLRTFLRDRVAVAGGVVFVVVLGVSILAPFISPFDPYALRPELRLAPPGTYPYLLGGDELGRDILSRLIWGSRASLLIGFMPIVVGSTLGSTLGLLSGFLGGFWDDLTMRILEVFQAFPSILLALGIAAAIGPGLENIILSLSVVSIPYFARVVRSSTMATRDLEYVTAAGALGARTSRIMFRHVVPNILSPVIVLITLHTGRMIILGAGLSFLGLGIRPPAPDWGTMLSSGQKFLSTAPHLATIPGLAIFLVTVSLNVLGDGLRDMLDPQQGDE